MAPKRKSVSYYLRRPGKDGRATFAIYKKKPDGQSRVKSESLTAVNKQFKAGFLTYKEANLKAEEILFQFQKSKKNWNKTNVEFLDKFWDEVYKGKDLRRPEAAKFRLRQALQALEELSLLTATRDEIIDKIASHPQQRRLASTLNTLLKWAGRDIAVPRQRKKRAVVRYMTLKQFKALLRHLPKDYRPLAATAFATGARLGECFAVGADKVVETPKGTFVRINEQLLRDAETLDGTKTGGVRRAPVISELTNYVIEWADLDPIKKAELRKLRHADIIRDASEKMWPDDTTKRFKFHDLRHCYAIHILGKGVPMDLVAGALGDSIAVCQEYYVGFELSNLSLDNVLGLL